MAQATIAPLPPAEAIAALQRRGQRLDPTFSWQDAWEAEHATMFTVAKSTGFDILRDVHDALVTAISQGQTFQDFARDLRPTLEAKGWWGRKDVVDPATGEVRSAQLGSTRRLRTIFDTNLRVSYAAGHWAQFERNRAARPILRYVAVLDGRVRPAHALRHNVALPIDDPFWDVWAPPCGWGCRCTLQSLSIRDFNRMKGELKLTPPAMDFHPYTNTRTGQVTWVADGIDPGWGYNPGKAGFRASVVADRLAGAPPQLAAAAVADPAWPAQKLSQEFGAWLDRAASGERPDVSSRIVGAIDRPVIDGLAQEGVRAGSGALAVDVAAVPQLLTRAVAQVPPAARIIRSLPRAIDEADAVLWDRAAGELLYVFGLSEYRDRLVVRVALTQAPDAAAVARLPPNAVTAAQLVARDELGHLPVLRGALPA